MRAAFQQPILAVRMRFAFAFGLAHFVGLFALQSLLGFAGLAFDLAAFRELGGFAVVFAGGGLVAFAFVALTHHVLLKLSLFRTNVDFLESFRTGFGRTGFGRTRAQ